MDIRRLEEARIWFLCDFIDFGTSGDRLVSVGYGYCQGREQQFVCAATGQDAMPKRCRYSPGVSPMKRANILRKAPASP